MRALLQAEMRGPIWHLDQAYSPTYYVAPEGLEGEPCRHSHRRVRIGPTSRRRSWMITVDQCGWCGRILRSTRDLTWRQYDWVRRCNRSRP